MQAPELVNTARVTRPRYQIAEFGNPQSVANWLNSEDLAGYRLLSTTPISVTNHFSKETETTVWVVAELSDYSR